MTPPHLPLGIPLITPTALDFCARHNIDWFQLLSRHAAHDWGDLCSEDYDANGAALDRGGRVFSCYTFKAGEVWIITDGADDDGHRMATTIMLPEDY